LGVQVCVELVLVLRFGERFIDWGVDGGGIIGKDCTTNPATHPQQTDPQQADTQQTDPPPPTHHSTSPVRFLTLSSRAMLNSSGLEGSSSVETALGASDAPHTSSWGFGVWGVGLGFRGWGWGWWGLGLTGVVSTKWEVVG